MERRFEEIRTRVQQHSQEVLERLVAPPRPRSTPITQAESQATAMATAGPPQERPRFQFNPLTGIHGEFRPGAAYWRRDERSRRVRAIERDQLRIEEADRNVAHWVEQHPTGVAESSLNPDAPTFTPARGARRAAGWSLRGSSSRGRSNSRGSDSREGQRYGHH
ncbi:MAG: hypothetical protein Q9225_000070 [Loekoesia sp. 1 TL-2023]